MPIGIEDDPRDITRMVAGLNSNMPVSRRTLRDYMDNGNLFYVTKAGDKVPFPRDGIDYLASVTDEGDKLLLRLPVLVVTDTSAERSQWKIEGRTEVKVMQKVLNRRVHTEDRLPVYYPDLADLKKVMPGLVFTVFLP